MKNGGHVTLYAIIQRRSEEAVRARTIAAMNIVNALFMTAAAAVTAVLLAGGFTTPHLYLALRILKLGGALWVCPLFPPHTPRMLAPIVLPLAHQGDGTGPG